MEKLSHGELARRSGGRPSPGTPGMHVTLRPGLSDNVVACLQDDDVWNFGKAQVKLQAKRIAPMIEKSRIMPLVLARCPGLLPEWEKHREFWGGQEAGIYNDMSVFAHYIVDAYERGDREVTGAAFGLIEELLMDGDEEVRDAAGIGFLEDVRNISSWRPFGSEVFVEWLGPRSREAWAEIEEMWRGRRSLADVVRAERSRKKGEDT